jgi:hypothetical protein
VPGCFQLDPNRDPNRDPNAGEWWRTSCGAPVAAPVTADTLRHAATFGDSESEAERHGATLPDTTRHAGWGLHTRRAPVRFLAHLPLRFLNSWGLAAL